MKLISKVDEGVIMDAYINWSWRSKRIIIRIPTKKPRGAEYPYWYRYWYVRWSTTNRRLIFDTLRYGLLEKL